MFQKLAATVLCAFLAGGAAAQKHVLVIGASVSWDWSAPSPGRKLAQRMGVEPVVIASPGNSGSATRLLPSIKDRDFENAAIVVAVDLFFWDSYRADCRPSLEALDALLARSRKARLVVGNVPRIEVSTFVRYVARAEHGTQACRVTINRALAERCRKPACAVLDLDSVYRGLIADGSLGRMMPDGLHFGNEFSERISRMIEASQAGT